MDNKYRYTFICTCSFESNLYHWRHEVEGFDPVHRHKIRTAACKDQSNSGALVLSQQLSQQSKTMMLGYPVHTKPAGIKPCYDQSIWIIPLNSVKSQYCKYLYINIITALLAGMPNILPFMK